MTAQHEPSTHAALTALLAAHGLRGDTRLYREAARDALQPTGAPGVYRLSANAKPSESVVDVYGQGHIVQAEQVGPGLAFAESSAPNWQETMEMRTLRAAGIGPGTGAPDRVEVEVRLESILEQGGLVYPVESVVVERAWYCTLPSGSVDVREVTQELMR